MKDLNPFKFNGSLHWRFLNETHWSGEGVLMEGMMNIFF
jgi:hypothetical protein